MDFTKKNEGTVDRAARGLFAVLFAVLGLKKARTAEGKVFLGLAVLLGVTAATGTCPAYLVTGVDTREALSVDTVKRTLGL